MNEIKRMKELIDLIREADVAYFQKDEPIMSDIEYDKLVLELKMLERSTGVRFSDSPVGVVPSDAKEGLKTVKHSKPMLSCEKTKDIDEVVAFAGEKEIVLSWKMDGLTLVLRYEKGRFVQAITRGKDGLVGEDVTHNVEHFRNIPHAVPCKDSFEVRGEGVVSWKDFEILSKLSKGSTHPRNIASGAVRSIKPDLAKLTHLDFFAFELIKKHAPRTKISQLAFLKENNFDVVGCMLVNNEDNPDVRYAINSMLPKNYAYPVDGIIAEYNDIAYGKSLGATAHHEKRMLALKWKDEIKETVFRGVELATTRTGDVSIIGLFDEVILDGTKVHRANLHSLSNFEEFRFGKGDIIRVCKANMIIPQIVENRMLSGGYALPKICPSCGESLTVRVNSVGTKMLHCPNEDCIAKNSKRIARFCDSEAMNIQGLSSSTIETLMSYGWIKNFKDLYHLDVYRDEIINTPGFDVDRYDLIWNAIKKSRRCHMYQFLVGLGIPLIGPEAAKILHQYYYGNMVDFEKAIIDNFQFSHIDGITPAIERAIYNWYGKEENQNTLHSLLVELNFKIQKQAYYDKSNPFYDTSVVVTGTFESFTREGLVEFLTALGARVCDTVEKGVDFLIYGALPGTKKVGLAMQNNVSMLSESKFAEMLVTKNQ